MNFKTITKNWIAVNKNVLKPLAKSVVIPLGLIAAASGTDAAIYKNMFRSGITTFIISNEEMKDVMKIVKSLEESGLFIKDMNETIKIEKKEQERRFFGMLLGTLSASLLGNLLTGKDTIRADQGTMRVGEGTIRAGQKF